MESEIETIKAQLEKLPKRAGKRQYTAAAKQAVVRFVTRWTEAGRTESSACEALGIHQATVANWRRGRKRRAAPKPKLEPATRVRPIEVASVEQSRLGALALHLPGDARVEGLTVEDLVRLIEGLR